MLAQLSAAAAAERLRQQAVSPFWLELGQIIDLPDDFIYLLIDGCLFVIQPVDEFYGIHAAIEPQFRGIKAVNAGRIAIQWCLARKDRVLAKILKSQQHVRVFARYCGMHVYSESATHVFYEVVKCR